MELKDLKVVMPYKWRVQSTNQNSCTCVAYIDARDVQDLLDDVCGAENWQVRYEEHKGNLFASIGINIEQRRNDNSIDSMGWVWKSDCGTESQVEKQKGEASDAFKRAAVMWGVGRFLYSLKIIKIKEVIQDGVDRNNRPKYAAAEKGKKIWDVNKYCNNLPSTPKPSVKAKKEPLTDKGFKFLSDKGTKEQIQEALNDREVTSIQKAALTVLKAFTDGSK